MSQEKLEELKVLFRELRLRNFGQAMEYDMGSLTNDEKSLLVTHVHKWATEERANKQTLLIQTRIKSAKFRDIKTIDDFDFTYNPATQKLQRSYMTLYQSIEYKTLPSAIFSGSAGMGKSHLARALGYAACQKGISVLFTTAAEMVNRLAEAQKTFTLESHLNKYRKPQVLIIDELGYVSLDTQASNLFFQVISSRYDLKLGNIATTNIPFGQFNQIFANNAIAHAIVDRLVNTAEVFYLEGEESYREFLKKIKKSKGK